MSDELKHECGVAMIRLLKPLNHYQEKYGTSLYGLNKMYLLMQKQVNRGQDGAGLANIKLDVKPGKRYISRYRSNKVNSVQDVFTYINKKFEDIEEKIEKKIIELYNMSFVLIKFSHTTFCQLGFSATTSRIAIACCVTQKADLYFFTESGSRDGIGGTELGERDRPTSELHQDNLLFDIAKTRTRK